MILPSSKGILKQVQDDIRGFTLIELLITISFVSILAFGFPTFAAYNKRLAVQIAAKQLKTDLREAQSRSFTGKKAGDNNADLAVWGIRLTQGSETYTLYSCPAQVVSSTEYNWNCVGKTTTDYTLKGSVKVSMITDYPPTGGMNIIFTSLGEGRVLFHDDSGATIQNGGVNVPEVNIELGIPGFGGDEEERRVRVQEKGNIEDVKIWNE